MAESLLTVSGMPGRSTLGSAVGGKDETVLSVAPVRVSPANTQGHGSPKMTSGAVTHGAVGVDSPVYSPAKKSNPLFFVGAGAALLALLGAAFMLRGGESPPSETDEATAAPAPATQSPAEAEAQKPTPAPEPQKKVEQALPAKPETAASAEPPAPAVRPAERPAARPAPRPSTRPTPRPEPVAAPAPAPRPEPAPAPAPRPAPRPPSGVDLGY